MSPHHRFSVEAVNGDCAFGDCGHAEGDCPTVTLDACRECSDASGDCDDLGLLIPWEDCCNNGAQEEGIE